jgi:adenylate kinase family enzyme
MKKVVVIGSPGAGKSIFATKLATATNLPLIHLDSLYHQSDKNYENNKSAWRRKVQELINEKSWIIDGNYSSTFDLKLPAADTIIFLNYPSYLCLWRVLKRRFKYRNRMRPDMPSTWREKADWGFIKYVASFKRQDATYIENLLEKYKDKEVIILTSPGSTNYYLSKIV